MVFDPPLQHGVLVRRYQRFLADIRLDDGRVIVAHCPNSGSMRGVNVPGSAVLVSYAPSPTRRIAYTWEMIHADGGWVGINTLAANRLAAEAFERDLIPAFRRYRTYRSEVRVAADTRIDFALGREGQCRVEVKNVTLVEGGVARFPDSVTTRGTKHLRHLAEHALRGGRAAMLYVIQHHAGRVFSPADDIDPVYGAALREAVRSGVRVEAWKAEVTPERIELRERVRAVI